MCGRAFDPRLFMWPGARITVGKVNVLATVQRDNIAKANDLRRRGGLQTTHTEEKFERESSVLRRRIFGTMALLTPPTRVVYLGNSAGDCRRRV
jgi:hypothetical protein